MITRFILCARRAIQDNTENDLSLIGLVEDFVAQGFPLVLPRVAVVWLVDREEGEAPEFAGTLRLTVDDQNLQESPFTATFLERRSARVILNIGGFACPRPGYYKFTMLIGGVEKASIGFRADANPQAVAAAQAPPPGGVFLVA